MRKILSLAAVDVFIRLKTNVGFAYFFGES